MEESGRGAAVEQLTARGMEYPSPRWGAIEVRIADHIGKEISIPAMGGNRGKENPEHQKGNINPRDGGQ